MRAARSKAETSEAQFSGFRRWGYRSHWLLQHHPRRGGVLQGSSMDKKPVSLCYRRLNTCIAPEPTSAYYNRSIAGSYSQSKWRRKPGLSMKTGKMPWRLPFGVSLLSIPICISMPRIKVCTILYTHETNLAAQITDAIICKSSTENLSAMRPSE